MERLLLQAPPGELAAVTDCVRTLCPDADAAALSAAQRQHNVDGFFVADVPGGGKARTRCSAHACSALRARWGGAARVFALGSALPRAAARA